MKKSIIYTRVSTNVQEEAGTIEQQVDQLKKYAENNGIGVLSIIKDENRSGADELRAYDLIKRIDELIHKFKQLDFLIVTKFDRLARGLFLQLWLEKELKRRKVEIITSDQPNMNGDDPTEIAFRHLIGVFAELERNMIKTRMINGKRYKFENQRQPVSRPAPLGYKWAGKKSNRHLVIDVERADIVREIFKKYLEIHSLRGVLKMLNKNRIKNQRNNPFALENVRHILRNEIYIGLIEFEGKKIRGDFDPIISEETFQRVKDTLKYMRNI